MVPGQGAPIWRSFTLLSTNLVYAITCKHCKHIYVGETGATLKQRLYQHLYQIKKINNNKLLYTHFIQHTISNLLISGLESNPSWSFGQRRAAEKGGSGDFPPSHLGALTMLSHQPLPDSNPLLQVTGAVAYPFSHPSSQELTNLPTDLPFFLSSTQTYLPPGRSNHLLKDRPSTTVFNTLIVFFLYKIAPNPYPNPNPYLISLS